MVREKSISFKPKFAFSTLLFFAIFVVFTAITPVHAADVYKAQYEKVVPLLKGECWSKNDCVAARGELVPQEDCKTTLVPATEEMGFCEMGKLSGVGPSGGKLPLNVKIGGLEEVENIGEYVEKFYIFSIGLGVVVAMIVIVHAGLLYAASAGNQQVITSAKKKIGDAIIGLLLLLGSYTLLFTINPDLVNLRPPSVKQIRSPEVIAEHLALRFADDVPNVNFACSTGWISRLNGYMKESNKWKQIKKTAKINGVEKKIGDLPKYPIDCGVVLPPSGSTLQPDPCISTFCADEESVCVLQLTASGRFHIDIMKEKSSFGKCANSSTVLEPRIADPEKDGDPVSAREKIEPWSLNFDHDKKNTCGKFEESTAGAFLDNVPDFLTESIGLSSKTFAADLSTYCDTAEGTLCYALTEAGFYTIENPKPTGGFVADKAGKKAYSRTPNRGVAILVPNGKAGRKKVTPISCP